VPQHDVKFDVPARPLGRADVTFEVKQNGKLLGKLEVSNGSLVWFPRGKRAGHKMGWSMFDEIMQEKAKRIEKR